MRLADFIAQNRNQIVAEWEQFARSLMPPGRRIRTAALRDHVAGILDAIVDDIRSFQSLEEQSAKSKGRGERRRLGRAGETHAILRIEKGFRLDQLVAEYRALRASVLRLWAETAGHEPDDDGVTRFNEAIDEALTESTNRYMQTLERHRDQFLGILGHDLRNPLGAIIMGASVLTASEGLDDRTARIAVRILNSAQRMDRMVGDLLDLTRTRLGAGVPLRRATINLGHLCGQVLAELRGAHPDATLRFDSSGDLDGDWDADRLAQVISNLVGNALQHGKKRGPVTIVARGERENVVLEIHNEGVPIPPDMLGRIFEPMVRLGGGEQKRSTSLGLGLYIAEQVVQAHGGRIGVASTKAGGTTFSVHLPRHAVVEQIEAPRAEKRRPTRAMASRRPPRQIKTPRRTNEGFRGRPRRDSNPC